MTDLPPLERDLERLVDGELSACEYRQLLKRVEHTPGGWRSCALRFLEHQALQEALADWPARAMTESVDRKRTFTARHPNPTTQPATRQAAWWVAPLLIGLLFGVSGSQMMVSRQPAPDAQFTAQPSSGPSQFVQGDRRASGRATPSPNGFQRPSAGGRFVSVSLGDAGRGHQVFLREARQTPTGVQIPLYPLTQAQRAPADSAITADVQVALRQAGQRVEQRWHYRPVQTSDGRAVVIPIEEVKLIPVTNQLIP